MNCLLSVVIIRPKLEMLSRNNTLFFLSVHEIVFGISRFLPNTPNITRIDHIKVSLIVPFINQRGKPMFRALNFAKYYK